MQIKELARAKVNLCLHITERQKDGFHKLDSIVGFADFGDELTINENATLKLKISGPYGDGLSSRDNLILDVAKQLKATAHVHLVKMLPIASGIGGGSADAAAMIRGLSKLNDQDFTNIDWSNLGADIPVCIKSQFSRMQGIGDDVSLIDKITPIPAVLVNPNKIVSTAKVFKALQNVQNPPIGDLPDNFNSVVEVIAWLKELRNDLEAPAKFLESSIGDVLAAISNADAPLVRMSGSGATCFGLFEKQDQAEFAAKRISKSNPDWWVKAGVIS